MFCHAVFGTQVSGDPKMLMPVTTGLLFTAIIVAAI